MASMTFLHLVRASFDKDFQVGSDESFALGQDLKSGFLLMGFDFMIFYLLILA